MNSALSLPGKMTTAALFAGAACTAPAIAAPMYQAEYHLDSNWGSGFIATISIHNTGSEPIADWTLAFDFDRSITNLWNGVILSHTGTRYTVGNAGWNADILPGQSASFGFQGDPGDPSPAANFELILPPPPPPPLFEVDYTIVDAWAEGFQTSVTIRNVGDHSIDGWAVSFDLDRPITTAWGAALADGDSGRPTFSSFDYNRTIAAGGQVSFNFIASGPVAEPTNLLLNDVQPVPEPAAIAPLVACALLVRRRRAA